MEGNILPSILFLLLEKSEHLRYLNNPLFKYYLIYGPLISVTGGRFPAGERKVRKDIVHLSLPLPSLRSVQGLG